MVENTSMEMDEPGQELTSVSATHKSYERNSVKWKEQDNSEH